MPTIGQTLRDNLTYLDISSCPDVSEAGNYVLRQKQPSICVVKKLVRPAETTQSRFYRRIVSSDFDEREQLLGPHRLPMHMRLHQFRDEMEAWYLQNDRAALRRMREELRLAGRPRAPGAAGARAGEAGPALRAGLNAFLPARALGIDADELDDDLELQFREDIAMIEGLRADEALEAADFFRRLEGGQFVVPPNAAGDAPPVGAVPPAANDLLNELLNGNNNENLDVVVDENMDVGEPGIPPTPPPFV